MNYSFILKTYLFQPTEFIIQTHQHTFFLNFLFIIQLILFTFRWINNNKDSSSQSERIEYCEYCIEYHLHSDSHSILCSKFVQTTATTSTNFIRVRKVSGISSCIDVLPRRIDATGMHRPQRVDPPVLWFPFRNGRALSRSIIAE